MKILHLLGATDDTGGILTVLRNLQVATASRGLEHVVWVNQTYRETRRPALNYRFSRFLLAESPDHLRLFCRALGAFGELKSFLAREPFDVLHAHSRGALVVAVGVTVLLLWRRPVLFTNHAYARRLGLYRWAARRRHLRTAVLTPNMARYYGLEADGHRVRIISASCADRFFEMPMVERRVRASDQPLRLVGLGNIVRWKNWHLVVEAMAGLHDAERRQIEFHHWGPVPSSPEAAAYNEELRQLLRARRLEDRVRFHGLSLMVEEPLREADFFILPSTNEPCSVALIEALALGVPAVVSASGGNVDIVQRDRTGLLFEPDQPDSLRDCLRRVLRGEFNPASPAEIRASVRHRCASAVADEYGRAYEEMSRAQANP
jgi:glycosyltransferase involved in cell wall biosynthesis